MDNPLWKIRLYSAYTQSPAIPGQNLCGLCQAHTRSHVLHAQHFVIIPFIRQNLSLPSGKARRCSQTKTFRYTQRREDGPPPPHLWPHRLCPLGQSLSPLPCSRRRTRCRRRRYCRRCHRGCRPGREAAARAGRPGAPAAGTASRWQHTQPSAGHPCRT